MSREHAAAAYPRQRTWRRMLLPAIAISAALAILGAYATSWPWLHWLFKPATTLLIAALAATLPTGERGYRASILAGLVLSTLGDVFLMLPGDRFVAGLASFLCAHVAYLVAFRLRKRGVAAVWPAVAYAALALSVLSVLWPKLPSPLHLPVLAYLIVLAAMAVQAATVWTARRDAPSRLAAIGGLFFVISDAALAINRFVVPFEASSVLVLATYWIAQVGIARSVASPVVPTDRED